MNKLFFLIIGLLLVGTLIFTLNPIKEKKTDLIFCTDIKSQEIDTSGKTINQVMKEFENSPDFQGYELKNYRSCNGRDS